MLSLIKTDCLQARKDKNKLKSNLLITLIGEIEMIGKNELRTVTDADCLSKVKAFRKNLTEMIELCKDTTKRADICNEFNMLTRYMPAQMTEPELREKIAAIISVKGFIEMKCMGQVMGLLKEDYDGQYDGKVASLMVKSELMAACGRLI